MLELGLRLRIRLLRGVIEKNRFLGIKILAISESSAAYMNLSRARPLDCLTAIHGDGTGSTSGMSISTIQVDKIKGTHNNLMCYSLIDEEKRKVNHVPLSMVSSYAIK